MPAISTLESLGLACLTLLAGHANSPTLKPSVREVTSLRIARAAHTATTLSSGEVLVVGGMGDGGGRLASVELFDPAGDSMRTLAPLAHARSGHTATLLDDGRVLVAGGYDGE